MSDTRKHEKAKDAQGIKAQLVPLVYYQKALDMAFKTVKDNAKELGLKVKVNGVNVDVEPE